MAKVPLAKHNDMIKAIPPDRSDKPLRTSILPRRSWCDRPIPYAHRSETAEKDIAIDAIPVANNISRRLLPPDCLGQLTGNPFGARMRAHTQPHKLPAAMPQDQKPVQQPKRDRRDQEQVHRCDTVGMIAKEGLPALRRRPPSPRHVLCDRGLSDIDAELEQLAVYPRCAPKRVCHTHLADEAANVRRCLRPATARSGFPAPIGSEAGAVPAHQRLRPYNLQSVQHPGSQAIEPNKQQAVDAVEGHSLRRFPPQDVELVPKHEDFSFQLSPRPEQPDQCVPDQPEKIAHRANYQPIRGRQSAVLSLR